MFVLQTFGALSLELDGNRVTGSQSQKRRLALLAVLAASGRQGVSRARAELLLWPESDHESARHSLAQLLYSLRQTLSSGAVSSAGGNLVLDPQFVSSDVTDFDDAMRAGDREAAVGLYRGPFLQGFHLASASEFEEWRAAQAESRARQTASALEFLACQATRKGEFDRAAGYWQRLASLEPLDSRIAASFMKALEAAGNLPGALQHAAAHQSVVHEQLGVSFDPAIASLVDQLRRRRARLYSDAAMIVAADGEVAQPVNDAPATSTEERPLPAVASELEKPPSATHSQSSETQPHGADSAMYGRSVMHRLSGTAAPVVIGLLIFVVAIAGVWFSKSDASELARVDPAAVAVLPFSYKGDSGSAYLGEGIVHLMSTNLDGAGELRAVNPRALLGFVHQSRADNTTTKAGDALARHFNANFFLIGDIVEAGGKIRITASLYERTPRLRNVASAAAEGVSAAPFPILDALTTSLLAQKFELPRDRLIRTAARTTYSLPALKVDLLGEQLLRQGKYSEAVEAFQIAVARDSTFSLAYYRLAIAAEFAELLDLGYWAAEQAVAHSQRLAENDRVLVEAYAARRRGEADEAERLYEQILLRHPDDVEAWFQLGEVLFHHNAYRGRSFVESKRAWQHVLALNPTNHFALVHLARVMAREIQPEIESVLTRAIATPPATDTTELKCFRAFTVGDAADRASAIEEVRRAPLPTEWQSFWRVAVYTHDLKSSQQLASVMLNSDLSATRSLGNVGLMLVMLASGRVKDAGQFGGQVVQPLPWSAKVPSPQFSGVGMVAPDTVASRELRVRLIDWHAPAVPRDSAHVSYEMFRDAQRRYLVGLLSVRIGDANGAASAARVLDTMHVVSRARGLPRMFSTAIRADLELSRGKPAEALRLLESSGAHVPIELSSPFGVEAYMGWLRAESLRLLNRDRDALAWYASRVDLFIVELPYLGPSELRQAQIYERLGDKKSAEAHYNQFLTLWKDADAEFQPTVKDARAHLAALAKTQ